MRKGAVEKELLSTHDVAGLLSVDPGAVIYWIEQGKLRAYRTPGGHRRVKRQDLLLFLKAYEMPEPPVLNGGPRTVLVMDDEAQARSYFKKMLEGMGLRVEEAEDGYQAGRKLEQLHPALVVLDINLPGVDGLQVCRDIRGDGRLAGTRVLAVTGDDGDEVRRNVVEAGADAFLPKGSLPEEFKNLAELLLGFRKGPEPMKAAEPSISSEGALR